jgi:hypothetical protein
MIMSSTALNLNNTVDIATAVKQYLRSSCVYLQHDNETSKPGFRYSVITLKGRTLKRFGKPCI